MENCSVTAEKTVTEKSNVTKGQERGPTKKVLRASSSTLGLADSTREWVRCDMKLPSCLTEAPGREGIPFTQGPLPARLHQAE